MVNTLKLIFIIFLVGLNILLCSVFIGLQFIYLRRFAIYESKRRRTLNLVNKSKNKHDTGKNISHTHQHSSKTIRSSNPPHSLADLHSHSLQKAKHSNDIATIAETHLLQAFRMMNFEWVPGDQLVEYSKLSSSKRRDRVSSLSIGHQPIMNKISKWWQRRNSTAIDQSMLNMNMSLMDTEQALFHLEQAAFLGNHIAQGWLASTLASGILPIHGFHSINHTHFKALQVPSDFADGGEQLSRSIVLWHMSAMQGNIEAAMALGFRHEYSAAMGKHSQQQSGENIMRPLISDEDVAATLTIKRQKDDSSARRQRSRRFYHEKVPPLTHRANPTAHYGVLGTCESAMTYYEAAANAIMDTLEASPLRAKVSPAIDHHNLAQIQMKGASSALEYTDKPDESEDALQYYRMRASEKNPNPDVNAAYTLAQYYHYGIRGVQQDMAMALKYYEIAADRRHWEAAGQAGKFHVWSMGLEENERDLQKAHNYFKMGMPGGLAECRYRFEAGADRKVKVPENSVDGDVESVISPERNNITPCDHPCINGMGLLYVFGVPDLVPIDISTAKEYFLLAKDMGNMDALYNLAMLALGWSIEPVANENSVERIKWNEYQDGSRPTKADFLYALDCLTRAANMGHVQAKHRLAMMYARGIYFYHESDRARSFEVVPKNCAKALSLFKDISMNGITISRRLRTAYKQFVAGQFESSLRNYLAAAETGSTVAQINAAFLLEQGHCLGMSRTQCMKASLRMWRAAARQGSEEACLRVGDFFYYGREYEDDDIVDSYTERTYMYKYSPLPWVRYLVYPEDVLRTMISNAVPIIKSLMTSMRFQRETVTTESSCSSLDNDQSNKKLNNNQARDLGTAVDFYRQAAEQHGSPRANFNLGSMYEWGIGLPQDFPMAKRHYDLAGTARKKEAAVAVQLALICMNVHEALVKLKMYWSSRKTVS